MPWIKVLLSMEEPSRKLKALPFPYSLCRSVTIEECVDKQESIGADSSSVKDIGCRGPLMSLPPLIDDFGVAWEPVDCFSLPRPASGGRYDPRIVRCACCCGGAARMSSRRSPCPLSSPSRSLWDCWSGTTLDHADCNKLCSSGFSF